MRTQDELATTRLVELGSVSSTTQGLFWGDYFDGLRLPLLGYKLGPG